MTRHQPIEVRAKVGRKQVDLPRFAVVPSRLIAQWELEATTTVEVAINGQPVARRSLQRWDSEKWFISITEQDCRTLGIDTGSTIVITLSIASAELPEELAALLRDSKTARAKWDRLTSSQQRMLREHIASARQSATRSRRARRELLGE